MGRLVIDGARRRVVAVGGFDRTVYELGEGPLVLCLHGFPDTVRTFRLLAPVLASAGYRVAAPVMRGYEPSSQAGDYSLAALAEDVNAIAEAIDCAPAHLIGHDWGASVAYAAAVANTARWRSLTTLAVPHPAAFGAAVATDYEQQKRSWYIFFFQQRGAAEFAVSADDFRFLERLWRDWCPGWTPEASDLAAMRASFAQPGVLEAALAYYRTAFDPAHPRAAESAALLAQPVPAPTLGIVGEDDACIAADLFAACMPAAAFAGGVTVARIVGAGHFVHLERPDAVHAQVLKHIAAH